MNWKKEFINYSLKKKVLQFGQFQLKSGRTSPYFFNSGLFSTGKDITKIGLFYAHSIIQSKINFDILFGPAYKGIPIVVATTIALKKHYNLNVAYAFNRKERKKYGEQGDLIGTEIYKKRIIILDDVITSGHAIHHSIKIIEEQKPKICSIFVLFDRKEKGQRDSSTIHHISKNNSYNITSIITIEDLITYLIENKKFNKHIPDLIEYRKKYGI